MSIFHPFRLSRVGGEGKLSSEQGWRWRWDVSDVLKLSTFLVRCVWLPYVSQSTSYLKNASMRCLIESMTMFLKWLMMLCGGFYRTLQLLVISWCQDRVLEGFLPPSTLYMTCYLKRILFGRSELYKPWLSFATQLSLKSYKSLKRRKTKWLGATPALRSGYHHAHAHNHITWAM